MHARNGIHVRDHRIGGQRLLRRDTGVERLEGEQPLDALVGDEPADHAFPAAESADRGQPGQLRGQQRQRGGEVGRDEAVELQPVELGEPGTEALVAGGLIRAGELLDGGRHRCGVGVHVQRAAIGEGGPVGGGDLHEVQMVGHRCTDGGERVLDDVRHRQHGRPGVDAVAGDVGLPHPTAGEPVTLDDGDRSPATGQLHSSRQP
ncbi:hypothetical protein Y900_022740 [Mycolicibacterium aromaticivorans JS19b1 = JCM 16368]|uniref:Uncharacterized protein n=1 Tax=Mycolicibacterium aromaticivorans JS19b1 = JCM 16368 TaxID=1440774 RepID=A0A064CMU7_9MYCO|nr:hypothetical protein Y900_022740 [Mycolicibacterium aromaticivorans JS19b1 = JCM 16368]